MLGLKLNHISKRGHRGNPEEYGWVNKQNQFATNDNIYIYNGVLLEGHSQISHGVTYSTAMEMTGHKPDFDITKYTPYLALTDKLWVAYCEVFWVSQHVIMALRCISKKCTATAYGYVWDVRYIASFLRRISSSGMGRLMLVHFILTHWPLGIWLKV